MHEKAAERSLIVKIACHPDTPIGSLTAIYEEGIIRRVLFEDEFYSAADVIIDDTLPFVQQIAAYFRGERKTFDLPFRLYGTKFAQEVYAAVLRIPYGQTATYSDIALAAGHPRAMRAVGNVMHDTPVPIVIPCHRVVHKSGTKTAYRGGTDAKYFLQDMEKRFTAQK